MNYTPVSELKISGMPIGLNQPTYFIADIAANHDGDLERAKDLIFLAAESGANAAKFQHFSASSIVSDVGFKSLGDQMSHQTNWGKSVYEVYKGASLDVEWTPVLKETCDKAGIAFLTSPYSLQLVDQVDSYVGAFKIGSGDITWLAIIQHMAKKGKPVLLATGASDMRDVQAAVQAVLAWTSKIVLMQCNTNYTASYDNFRHIQLNVLKTYAAMYPDIILGLSDHTPGHATVLGAVALGGRVVEKHFTDDNSRTGPDHGFSLDPAAWLEMVDRTRELEQSLGSGVKQVETNEEETVILQRRSIRAAKELKKGAIVREDDLELLRPCPLDALPPYMLNQVTGKKLVRSIARGVCIRCVDLV